MILYQSWSLIMRPTLDFELVDSCLAFGCAGGVSSPLRCAKGARLGSVH